MERVTQDLEPVDQPDVNRLVVGTQYLKIENLEPLGCVCVETPSGFVTLDHAASVECRCQLGYATYVFGELGGRLVGARSA